MRKEIPGACDEDEFDVAKNDPLGLCSRHTVLQQLPYTRLCICGFSRVKKAVLNVIELVLVYSAK